MAAGRLFLACRQGTGLSQADFAAASIVERVDDPLVRLSFGHAHCGALVFSGRYQEAIETIDRQIAELERYGLAFALPHSYLVRAAALQGMRRFSDAMRTLDKVDELSSQEQYMDASVTTLRSLTSLSRGDLERAREILGSETYEHALPSMHAEYFGARALVLACSGDAQGAARNAQLAVDSRRRSSHVSWLRSHEASWPLINVTRKRTTLTHGVRPRPQLLELQQPSPCVPGTPRHRLHLGAR